MIAHKYNAAANISPICLIPSYLPDTPQALTASFSPVSGVFKRKNSRLRQATPTCAHYPTPRSFLVAGLSRRSFLTKADGRHAMAGRNAVTKKSNLIVPNISARPSYLCNDRKYQQPI
jgi:hypothetical protein